MDEPAVVRQRVLRLELQPWHIRSPMRRQLRRKQVNGEPPSSVSGPPAARRTGAAAHKEGADALCGELLDERLDLLLVGGGQRAQSCAACGWPQRVRAARLGDRTHGPPPACRGRARRTGAGMATQDGTARAALCEADVHRVAAVRAGAVALGHDGPLRAALVHKLRVLQPATHAAAPAGQVPTTNGRRPCTRAHLLFGGGGVVGRQRDVGDGEPGVRGHAREEERDWRGHRLHVVRREHRAQHLAHVGLGAWYVVPADGACKQRTRRQCAYERSPVSGPTKGARSEHTFPWTEGGAAQHAPSSSECTVKKSAQKRSGTATLEYMT
eukprot:scaffold546_cov352-Prasinococcus_capsulatus_cf.AAC.5